MEIEKYQKKKKETTTVSVRIPKEIKKFISKNKIDCRLVIEEKINMLMKEKKP